MEFGKVEFDEGTYLGQIEDGKANGYGVMNYKNGDIYVGEWQDNCQTGQGAKKTDAYVSMGYFVKGKRDGKFCTVENDPSSNRSNYYIGDYYNDVKSGHGVFVNYLHEAIVGNFKNDLANGKGFLSHFPTINDGYFAEGNFVNGRLSGQYTSYAKTRFSNDTTFYGHTIPELNYYTGFGEWIDKGSNPERRIGYHNKSVNERSAYNFKGVKIFDHGEYDSKKSVEEGDYGNYVIGKTDGVFSKIYKDGAMYIGEYELNKMKGNGTYAIFEPAKYGQPKPNLFFRIIDGKETIKLNSSLLATLEIKRAYGDNIEVWNNGTLVIDKWGVSGRTRSDRTINFPTYHGKLNDGYGGYSGSPYLGESSFSATVQPTYNEVKTTNYGTRSVDTSNSYSQPKTANSTQTSTAYVPPKHEYNDGYGEKISFRERVKLEIENRKEMRELKNNPPPIKKEPKKEVVPNETVKKLNEEYEFENHRQILVGVKVKKEVHIIPPSVESIKTDAFIGDETIKEIKGGQNLKYIEGCAFSGCKNLETVDFSKTHLRCFESNVFENCVNLKTVILPRWDVVPTVKPNAFSGCDNLSLIRKKPNEPIDIDIFIKNQYHEETEAEKKWRLVCEKRNKEWEEKERKEKEEKEKSYKDNGFIIEKKGNFACLTTYDNKNKKVFVPSGAERIETKAFSNLKNILEEIIIDYYTKDIEKSAFEDFTNLVSVDFSRAKDCYNIDSGTFRNCKKLKGIEFNGGGSIGVNAFSDCTSLERAILPNVRTLHDRSFYGCSCLKEVNLLSVNCLCEYAFFGCSLLKEINAPNLKSIEKLVFFGCVSLEKLVVNKDCKIERGALPKELVSNVKKVGETKVITFAKKDKNFINNLLFKFKPSKEEISEISNQVVQKVEPTKTTPKTVANPINVIDNENFYIVDNVLKKVKIGKEEITVPNGVTRIDQEAFGLVKKVVKKIILPSSLFEDGLAVGVFEDMEKLEEVVTEKPLEVSAKCFKNCKNLKRSFIVANLRNIEESAFENCQSIKSITIKTSYILDRAFYGCTNLEKVNAFGVIEVSSEAFIGCENIKKIIVSPKCKIHKTALPKYYKIKTEKYSEMKRGTSGIIKTPVKALNFTKK